MNNLKALLLILMATGYAQAQYKMEEGPKASKPTDQWKFELSNKSKHSITLSAYHQHGKEKNYILQVGHIIEPKGKLRIANLKNKRWDTILNLAYTKNNKEKNVTITIPAVGQDKQLLIKFENDLLMPQLGTLAGAGAKQRQVFPSPITLQNQKLRVMIKNLLKRKLSRISLIDFNYVKINCYS
ncbi:hypothetical protein Noda2021_03080 [Candidatus Dependentiae bacterium Noda2021]|nr:hypothetical protein Noda2021_03080 [Candidatus Dependentiae bacterium Noda2021]